MGCRFVRFHVMESFIVNFFFLDKTYADCLLPVACELRALRFGCLGSADDEFMR